MKLPIKELILSHGYVKDSLFYYPDTGIFRWRLRDKVKASEVGAIAGKMSTTGLWIINIDNHFYLASRLAYFYMEGHFPRQAVSFINGNVSDNRYANLCLARPKQEVS